MSPSGEKMRILVFGNSIAYGAWDEEGGWADRLKRFVIGKTLSEKDFRCHIMNLSISGDTTDGLVSRYESEAEQRECEDETITIFAIGINDTQFSLDERKVKIPPNDFEDNSHQLANQAADFSSEIILVGLTPVDEEEVNPWKGKVFRNKYIKGFNDLIQKFCKEKGLHFIPVFEKFKEGGHESLLEDGLHPNTEGHQKLYEIVKNYLIEGDLI